MYFEDWGLIPYKEAVDRQIKNVHEVIGGGEERIIFCSHPPVVTLGRSTRSGDNFGWQGECVEVSRGGRATYHGPGQIIVYPILSLNKESLKRKKRDIWHYLRTLEMAIVKVLEIYDLKAQGKSLHESLQGEEQATGVWVGDKKIASVGVAIKNWVTYHGAAINVDYDSEAFQGIHPCGYNSQVMISLEELLDKKIDKVFFIEQIKLQLTEAFEEL